MDYRIISLDEHTWRIEEEGKACWAYMYLVEGSKRAALIDTGYGQIPLDKIVKELTKLPVAVINTHFHGDHVGGNPYFEKAYLHEADLPYYQDTKARFAAQSGSIWEKDTCRVLTITDGQEFDLGDRRLQVVHTPGHSVGCVCLLDPDRRWLFGGDTCCRADVLLNLPGSTSIAEYGHSIEKLRSMTDSFDIIWPGHHGVPVTPEVLDQFAEGVRRLLSGEQGGVTQTVRGPSRKLCWKDIGIIYPMEE